MSLRNGWPASSRVWANPPGRSANQVRETVTFAVQNLITDASFSRMDLISCRNVLIYLEPEMQKQIIALLHFALKEGGYLFLGPSETVGRQTELFEPVSKKWRIYRRIGPARADGLQFPAMPTGPRHATPQPAGRPPVRPGWRSWRNTPCCAGSVWPAS